MNKKDLRYLKTEKLITDAYCDLKKSGKNVRVKDLCTVAMINKSTFYEHYVDMAALERSVQTRIVAKTLNECPHIKEAFRNTSAFCRSIIRCFSEKGNELDCYFSCDRMLLCAVVEQELLKIYNDRLADHDLKIRFVIGGAAHVLIENDSENIVDELIELINKVITD